MSNDAFIYDTTKRLSTQERAFLSSIKPLSQYSRKSELTREIIKGVAISGFIIACLVTPGLAGSAKLLPKQSSEEKRRLRQLLKRLQERNLIEPRGTSWVLTPKGSIYLHKIYISEFTLPPRPRSTWDRMWHMVVFTIPELHRDNRDLFRAKLLEQEYVYIQDSIYVHCFDYSKEIKKLAEMLGIPGVITMHVSKIDGELNLKKKFCLR